jgi:hypothetical protein
MMRRLGLLTALCGLVSVAGCVSLAPASCDESIEFEPPARLTCEIAIAAARGQLIGVAGITQLSFDFDHCPPNARCAASIGDSGEVIATLTSGDQLMVLVRIGEDGVVRADEPIPVEAILDVIDR